MEQHAETLKAAPVNFNHCGIFADLNVDAILLNEAER